MRFQFGHIVEHPDFVLCGRILIVDEKQLGYIIEDLYTGINQFYPDTDDTLQLYRDQEFTRSNETPD